MCGGQGRAVTLCHVRVKIPAGTVMLQEVTKLKYDGE